MAAVATDEAAVHESALQQECHEDLFVRRYAWLRDWAMRLAGGDRVEAEDLLHNAFLQFVVRRRELSEIENLEAYLYGVLRRLRLSSARSARRRRQRFLALDYDVAADCLADSGVHGPLHESQVEQELATVCEYACRRKSTSKSGSVLILRFFHGYYPGEIARILRAPLRLANDWLRIARHEARAQLKQAAPRIFDGSLAAAEQDERGADILTTLRARIGRARTGPCLTPFAIRRLYDEPDGDTISCTVLSHIVSCPACLRRVTDHLQLAPYAERDPRDMLGPDGRWRAALVVATLAVILTLWAPTSWLGEPVSAHELIRSAGA